MSSSGPHFENPDARAASLGLRCVRPEDNELFLDVDSLVALELFKTTYWPRFVSFLRALDLGPLVEYTVRESRSPGHYHVTVTLNNDLDPIERVLLQTLLGSDPNREYLAFGQIRAGYDNDATVFFEPKESA